MQKLWFKSKRYGWGWTPSSWEGWLVTLAFMAYILWLGFTFDIENNISGFYNRLGFTIAILIVICYKTGETPKWRWGN